MCIYMYIAEEDFVEEIGNDFEIGLDPADIGLLEDRY